ncbi:hypothetical protein [Avibacterium paragallinarum]|uniref:Uncharacterized protein n=2 Tax=Avibacterium paragallinarum TaxID=728 RepID=A0A377IUS4_AVIPA|nr:hypothetical protein [Avibacterium paragallinarum]UXN35480.1 hypothetical protein N8E86_04575 [Avibacterium paragallinarum]CDF98172.1 Hypothetical protein AJF4211_000070 [Avibacterium paragallinarum JF4211]CDF98931.1 Hypothetical protein AJF4211_000260 [Avibacterium paragallinarum JF4211]STO71080.1 Uncharacterised protein [Avibacterium paragallinarum]STO72521.1 Uncharacterised protein [Avibacterium paragallinarum]
MNYHAEIDVKLTLGIEAETKDDAICYIDQLLEEIHEGYAIGLKYRINFVNEEGEDEE